MTVHILDVPLVFERTLKTGLENGALLFTMARDHLQKSDITPSPGVTYSRGKPQNFFQDFVCCICGYDATLTHGQTDSLYCEEHHPETQNQKENKENE